MTDLFPAWDSKDDENRQVSEELTEEQLRQAMEELAEMAGHELR